MSTRHDPHPPHDGAPPVVGAQPHAPAAPPESNPLSEREMEVARLLTTGASNAEIARDLVISPHTVKVHLRNIFDKLQVSSRTEATMLLVQRGWISVPGMVRADEIESATEPELPELPPLADLPPQVAPWQRYYLLGALTLALLFLLLPFLQGQSRSSPPLLSDAGVRGNVPPMTADARWQSLAALPTARSRHAAALVGDHFLIFGGETDNGRLLRSVYDFDLTVNRWREAAPMPAAVSNASAAVLGDAVYVAGGTREPGAGETTASSDPTRVPTAALWRFDRAENRWSVAGELPMPLAGAVLTADGGALYLVGGWDGTAMRDEVWRLVLDETAALTLAVPTATASSPLATAAAPARPSATATRPAATRVASAAPLSPLQTSTPRPTSAPASPTATNAGVTVTPNSMQLAVTTAGTESIKADDWEVITRLPSPRAFLGAVLVENLLYVAGGFDGKSELASTDLFDLTAGRWQPQPDMGIARSGFSLVFDGVALVALGGGWLDTVVEHERLDPAINVWTYFASPLQGSWRHLAAASAQGNLYLAGGWSGDYLSTFVQYQSTFRAWLPVITTE